MEICIRGNGWYAIYEDGDSKFTRPIVFWYSGYSPDDVAGYVLDDSNTMVVASGLYGFAKYKHAFEEEQD